MRSEDEEEAHGAAPVLTSYTQPLCCGSACLSYLNKRKYAYLMYLMYILKEKVQDIFFFVAKKGEI